ncbi:MAG: SapC family protein [Thalassotalea sp.]
MANFVAVKKEKHQNLKVADRRGLDHVKNQHLIGATAKEFNQLATSFPLFFIKEGEVYRSVALLGLESGENLFYFNDRINAISVPQALALSPFALGLDDEKENTLTACLDLDSPYVGEDKEIALFDAEGNESEVFKSVQESLGKLYENEVMSEKFVKELVENELLMEYELLIDLASGDKKRLVGLYGIDEKKLFALSDEKSLDFHKRGLFVPIHSMMISMGQVNRLVQLRNEHSDVKVAGIKLQPRTAD